MIKALVSDFSGVLLSPADANYTGLLNDLYKELSARGEYDFWAYFRVNDDLLAFYKSICERINMYMFTREYLQEHPALQTKWKGVFTYIFSGARLDLKKTDPEAYKKIANKINLKPEEVLYIDDNQKNLDAAKQAGLNVILFRSNDQIMADIEQLL